MGNARLGQPSGAASRRLARRDVVDGPCWRESEDAVARKSAVDSGKKKPNDRDARVSSGRRAFVVPGRRRDARVTRAAGIATRGGRTDAGGASGTHLGNPRGGLPSSSFGFLPAPAIETGVRAKAQRLAPREGFRAVTPSMVASWSAASDICAEGLFGISAHTRVIRPAPESCELLANFISRITPSLTCSRLRQQCINLAQSFDSHKLGILSFFLCLSSESPAPRACGVSPAGRRTEERP